MNRRVESAALALCFCLHVALFSKMLVRGVTTITHDGFYMVYPAFHFLTEGVLNGYLPLWDPFNHAGQPFYPLLAYFKLLDPLTFLVIGLGGWITKNITVLFNWYHLLSNWILIIGSYLFLRRWAKEFGTKLLLMMVLCFSSYVLTSFRQPAFLAQCQYIPFCFWLFWKAIVDRRPTWSVVLAFSALFGLTFQSYFFTGIFLAFFLVLCGFLIFERNLLLRGLGTVSRAQYVTAAVVLIGMAAPNFVLVREQSEWVSPVRIRPVNSQHGEPQQVSTLYEVKEEKPSQSIFLSYESIQRGGGRSRWVDFFQILYPDGNQRIHGTKNAWGQPTEIYLYIGILPCLLVIWGVFCSGATQANIFRLLLIGSGLCMLGPSGGLHRILFWIFPPLWVVRHTNLFGGIFLFSMLFFMVQGAENFLSRSKLRTGFSKTAGILFGCVWIIFLLTRVPNPHQYGRMVVLCGLLPLVLPLRVRWMRVVLLLLPVAFDLGYAVRRSSYLYEGQKAPAEFLLVPATVQRPEVPLTRFVAPTFPYKSWNYEPIPEQTPRYLGILYRKSFALSGVMGGEGEESTLETALKAPRWAPILYLRSYHDLIFSGRDPKELATMLGLGSNLIEFRSDSSRFESHFDFVVQRYRHGSVTFQVKTDRPGHLVWRDSYDSHWRASLNAFNISIEPTDGNSKAIHLPAGENLLRLDYEPKSFLLSLIFFYFFHFIALGSGIYLAVNRVCGEG